MLGTSAANGELDINSTVAVNATVSGNNEIHLEEVDGDLAVGLITAGNGSINLETVTGGLVDADNDLNSDIVSTGALNVNVLGAGNVGIDIDTEMNDVNKSVFVRIPFRVSAEDRKKSNFI